MASIDYRPHAGGFFVKLTAATEELTVEGRGLDDAEPIIDGSAELVGNVALRALVLGYAANELAYRRSRSEEKRKSHATAASDQRRDALALADLVSRLEDSAVTAWCSGCFSRAGRRKVRGASRPAGGWICDACGTSTVACAVPRCKHHAVVRPRAKVNLCYCAEHHHEIPSFERLAVATGGLGMAGGTAVVTATGTALGGALGASTLSAYTSADKSFRIEKLRDGVGTPVIFATGFLTEGLDGWESWRPIIDGPYPDAPVYQVHWGGKELKDIAGLVATSAVQAAVRAALIAGAKRGSKAFGLPGLGWVLGLRGLASNPWTVARTRAGMTGVALGTLLARCEEGPFVLVGHSLGARVMVSAAQTLSTKPGEVKLEDVHLLGAAVGRKGDWRGLNEAVSGRVWNYWSRNDDVLRWPYTLVELGETAAGQAGFASRFPRITDRNVSRRVARHSDYINSVRLEA